MSEFPPELLHEILVRLPPDDLIRCLSVSKPWNSFIRQRSFIKSHLRRSLQTDSDRIMVLMTYSGDDSDDDFGDSGDCFCTLPFEGDDDTFAAVDPVKIEQPFKFRDDGYTCRIGTSVHGLLCLVNRPHNLFAVWNPSIRRFKNIPFPTITGDVQKSQPLLRCSGFGYDPVNDDYKLVYVAFTAECLLSNVYSLKRNSWKMMNNRPHDGFSWTLRESLFLGGAVCWMMCKQLDGGRQKYVILTFDLATEEYVEFCTPVDVYHQCSNLILVVLGGLLCIHVFYHVRGRGWKQDVWIMKEFGVAESWTLLCSMVESDVRQPLAFSKNHERVLLLDSMDRFFWYDIEEKISREVDKPGLKDCYDPTICVRTLCLLDGDPVIR